MGSPFEEHSLDSTLCTCVRKIRLTFLEGVDDEECKNDNLGDGGRGSLDDWLHWMQFCGILGAGG